MQETANKQKRITLKTVHQMLDGMSVELAEKVHLLFMAFFDFPRPLLAKRGSTSPCIPSPQAREKLRISRIPHSQSSGIAREACALKGERWNGGTGRPKIPKDDIEAALKMYDSTTVTHKKSRLP